MSKIEVNTVDVQCGSTLTLGSSGKTVTLATGASQSGFGRSGSVNWCTTAKTGPLTGVSGNGYFINTTGGAITVTLPASPSAGDIIAVKDYTGTAGTNAITIARNGSKIRSACACIALEQNNAGTQLVYVDGTEGWQYFNCGSDGDIGNNYTVATGGTITTSGDYKIHTFTSSSDFVVSSVGNSLGGGDKVSYTVVAGGGGGSRGAGGGGGAGGFREGKCTSDPYTASPLDAGAGLVISTATFPITVGAGGAKSPNGAPSTGSSGSVSTFSSITSAGGGGGNMNTTNPPASNGAGVAGGSGGGGGHGASASPRPTAGGAGNTPPVSPPQGNSGGNGSSVDNTGSGGGGGATAAGGVGGPGAPSSGLCGKGGNGGAGATTVITGSPVGYAGGGGGGSGCRPDNATGSDGGAPGGRGPSTNAGTATANRGGGGGGAGYCSSSNGQSAGGSGVVIIRYKFQN